MQEVGIVGSKLYLSPAETATLLGISRATIYRHMAVGIIRALQLRGRTIIRKSDMKRCSTTHPLQEAQLWTEADCTLLHHE